VGGRHVKEEAAGGWFGVVRVLFFVVSGVALLVLSHPYVAATLGIVGSLAAWLVRSRRRTGRGAASR
jgi:hypothetical protein